MDDDDPSRASWPHAFCAAPVHDPPRALVAEDDREMRALVVQVLRSEGLEVTEVADGGRLLVSLARETAQVGRTGFVDLIVSDIRMPVCTGLQILEQLRAVRRLTPVIIMTAFGDSTVRARARALGAILLDKPFEMESLRAAIACALFRQHA